MNLPDFEKKYNYHIQNVDNCTLCLYFDKASAEKVCLLARRDNTIPPKDATTNSLAICDAYKPAPVKAGEAA